MDTPSLQWKYWCLLCAKEDTDNGKNINVASSLLSVEEDTQLSLKETIERFLIPIPGKDILPKSICTDCYAFLVSIIRFSERARVVQQMYNFLIRTTPPDSCDLKSIRHQFAIFDESRQLVQTEDCETKLDIKQENCGAEEMVYDEECLGDYGSVDQKDPIEYNDHHQSGSFTEEDTANETLEETTNENNSSLENDLTVKRHKNKKKLRKLEDAGSNKKEFIVKDFSLDALCTECGKKFSLYSTYCEHIKVDHANTTSTKHWKCPSCGRVLQTWYNFERHMRIHMPVEDRLTLKCPECDNRYLSNASLETHIKQKHSSEKPFICEECGLGLQTLSNLQQHMVTHSDATPFECEICKKNFKTVIRLRRHLDTHSPNKHVCTVCGLELNSRTTLKRHLLVHSDEMQHKCDYCGRAFKRSKTLKNHLLLHTGLKPYSCNFCDRTFADGSNYRNHLKKKHPEELAALEASGNKTRTQKPKLEKLKALTKTAENLSPVVTKSSGCFAVGII